MTPDNTPEPRRADDTVGGLVRPFPIAIQREDGRYNICRDERSLMVALRVLKVHEHRFLTLAFITPELADKVDPPNAEAHGRRGSAVP